ncbi:MAG: Fe-S protein assembly co-chaperone HscB [Planctomycetes bacterium]|nr:Fe-S protein assembly co-chaperone HscB [Planctomycetota bacterium]
MSSDPFRTLGLAPDLHLDRGELERRYVELSRASHPDHHALDADAARLSELLDRSAAINDAYRTLADRFRRAEALLELRAPGTLDAHKQLDPDFLLAAMELAERVATVGDAGRTALAAEVDALLDADFAAIAAALDAGDHGGAATRLHQSRYHRKARSDLRSGDSR